MRRVLTIIFLLVSQIFTHSCITIDDLLPPQLDEYIPGEGDKPSTSSAIDLAINGETANCYIVSSAGTYKFKPVKGNSSTSVGSVSKVEVLWESFGTATAPKVGDLIKSINYDSSYVVFSTPSSFKEGNAVIAAKDATGTILWSWHIWLTDQPEGQVYYNNAGTMMDRNLGAISATPGDVGALGLLYQWGRKDPFLGSSSISSNVVAKSTATWPSSVSSSTSIGNVDYATANPMTMISGSESSDYDWHYSSRNNDLWKSDKTIYDPCPAGWRVPDGGDNGVWVEAGFDEDVSYDDANRGVLFGNTYSTSAAWYPASGLRVCGSGLLKQTGQATHLWSCTADYNYWSYLFSCGYYSGALGFKVHATNSEYRGHVCLSVRCFKE